MIQVMQAQDTLNKFIDAVERVFSAQVEASAETDQPLDREHVTAVVGLLKMVQIAFISELSIQELAAGFGIGLEGGSADE